MLLPRVVGEGAAVDLRAGQTAPAGECGRGVGRPGEQRAREDVGERPRELGVDDHRDQDPAGRPVVHRAPGAGRAANVADEQVPAHLRTATGDLHLDVVERRGGPAARGRLVAAQQRVQIPRVRGLRGEHPPPVGEGGERAGRTGRNGHGRVVGRRAHSSILPHARGGYPETAISATPSAAAPRQASVVPVALASARRA